MILTIGTPQEEGADHVSEVIPGYSELVQSIVANFPSDGIRIPHHTPSIGTRVISDFSRALAQNAVSDRILFYIIEHRLPYDLHFQELIARIATQTILSGNSPDELLRLMEQHRAVFLYTDFIFQNPDIQAILKKRHSILEEYEQQGAADLIRRFLLP